MAQALPLEIYVRKADDSVTEVRREIEKDVGKGLVAPERAGELQELVTTCMAWRKTHGYVEERHDPRDWVSLGEGGHMRVKHLDENCEHVPSHKTITIEQELTKENEDE